MPDLDILSVLNKLKAEKDKIQNVIDVLSKYGDISQDITSTKPTEDHKSKFSYDKKAICKYCGKEFLCAKPQQAKFCSRKHTSTWWSEHRTKINEDQKRNDAIKKGTVILPGAKK